MRLRDKGVQRCSGTVGRFFLSFFQEWVMADVSRRRFLQASMLAGGAMLLPGVMQAAWAAGSDKPEQETVRVINDTLRASLVLAGKI